MRRWWSYYRLWRSDGDSIRSAIYWSRKMKRWERYTRSFERYDPTLPSLTIDRFYAAISAHEARDRKQGR